jgi:hypothetical protein
MRHLMIPMFLVGGFVALTTTEASAVIYCAAGVHRAGCVARPAVGAVVVAPGAAVVRQASGRCRASPPKSLLTIDLFPLVG